MTVVLGTAGAAGAQTVTDTAPQVLDVPVEVKRMPAALRDDATAAGTVVEAPAERAPLADLGDAIEHVPGVNLLSSGSAGSFQTLSVRGASGQQTEIYVDGIPMNRAFSGMAEITQFPLAELARVDVYRSASPFSLGAGALGGAIALETRGARKNTARASLAAGSFETVALTAYAARVRGAGWMSVSLAGRRSEGDFLFVDDNGTAFDKSDDRLRRRQNNDHRQLGVLVKGGYRRSAALTVEAAQSVFAFEAGIPGNGRRPTSAARRDDLRTLSQVTLRGNGGGAVPWRYRVRGHFWFERERQQDPQAEVGLTRNDRDDRTRAGGVALFGELTPHPDWRVAAKTDVLVERFFPSDAFGFEAGNARSARTRVTPGAQVRWQAWSRKGAQAWPLALALVADGRVAFVDSNVRGVTLFGNPVSDPDSRRQRPWSLRLGTELTLRRGWQLVANVSRAERLPTLLELFGNSGSLLPSPALRPEHGWNLDVGTTLRHRFANGRDFIMLELFYFHRDVDDIIQLIRSNDDTVVAVNLDGARLQGIEAALQADVFDLLRAEAAYTLLETEQRSDTPQRDGNSLPLRPRTTWHVRGELYHRPAADWMARVSAWSQVSFESGNVVDPANFVRIDDRLRVDAGTRWHLRRPNLRIEMTVRNVTDQQTADLIGFPLPGRSYLLRLSGSL